MAETNHTIIVFDNRGTGQTNDGTKTFSIRQFPDDAAGLLDALHIKRADVPGASLGSFVAQELALNYPNKVDKLILSATYYRGNGTVYPSGKSEKMLMILASPDILKNMTAEQQAMILASIMFPQQWLRENPEIEHCNVGSHLSDRQHRKSFRDKDY